MSRTIKFHEFHTKSHQTKKESDSKMRNTYHTFFRMMRRWITIGQTISYLLHNKNFNLLAQNEFLRIFLQHKGWSSIVYTVEFRSELRCRICFEFYLAKLLMRCQMKLFHWRQLSSSMRCQKSTKIFDLEIWSNKWVPKTFK